MPSLIWGGCGVQEPLRLMLETLGEAYPVFQKGEGIRCVFEKGPRGLTVRREGQKALIRYGSTSDAARAVGILLSSEERDFELRQEMPFKVLGIHLDCSRNAVFEVEHLKEWIRRIALFGFNAFMLYTEDTYALPGEPFFGYLRGRYEREELRELDGYASALGVEMIGCIQTLGHLTSPLRWPAYRDMRDTPNVLLAGSENTYKLTAKMLDFWSEVYRSRRIHIGMDEAHGLGRGRYMDINGYHDAFEIFNRHLGRLASQCSDRRLHPMIWSDMYFRIGSKSRDYYDPESVIPRGAASKIPPEVQLVYWDYYHDKTEFYAEWIKRHKQMGFLPVMASGIRTYLRFWYDHEITVSTVNPCIEASIGEGVEDFILTMWGDDGAYCDFDSSMAGLCFVSERIYSGAAPRVEDLRERFRAVCGSDYDVHVIASSLSYSGYEPQNLLWDDPILGIYWKSKQKEGERFWENVLRVQEEVKLFVKGTDIPGACGDIGHLLKIHDYLKHKIILKLALDRAYFSGDRKAVSGTKTLISSCFEAAEQLAESFRSFWYRGRKPHGFEVLQGRLSLQTARLRELEERIAEYSKGKIQSIPELEESAEGDLRLRTWKEFASGAGNL